MLLFKNKGPPKLNFRETFYLMVLIFSHPMYHKYALPIFLIYAFDKDDMKSSERHVTYVNFLA